MTGFLSRRLFVRSAGLAAAAAAPIAVASVAAAETDDTALRLRRLEDEKAVRALQQAYLTHVNAGAHGEAAKLFADPAVARTDPTLRSLAPMPDASDAIEIAADGQAAVAKVRCLAATETPIEGRGTLLDMARAQGEGVIRRSEPRLLELAAVRREGGWRIESVLQRPI